MKPTYDYDTSWAKIGHIFPLGDHLDILDLGCGDGRVSAQLVGRHDVVGVDDDEKALMVARQRGLKTVQQAIDQPLPFKEGSFDVVLALDVLEHVVDVPAVLQNVYAVLRSNGTFVISIPNHFDVRTRLGILFGRGIIRWSQRRYEKAPETYSHVRFWTLSEFERMLSDYGWYPEVRQYNFMSQGLFPTRFIPGRLRRALVSVWPQAWSGKFVYRCVKDVRDHSETIILDRTPDAF